MYRIIKGTFEVIKEVIAIGIVWPARCVAHASYSLFIVIKEPRFLKYASIVFILYALTSFELRNEMADEALVACKKIASVVLATLVALLLFALIIAVVFGYALVSFVITFLLPRERADFLARCAEIKGLLKQVSKKCA